MTSVADLVVTHIDTYWDPEITPKPKIAKVIAMPIEKQVGESILIELVNQRWDPLNSEYANEVSRLVIRIYTNKTDTRLTDFANEVDRIFANYSVSGYDVNNVVATDDVSQRQSNFFQTKTLELTRLSVYRGTPISGSPPSRNDLRDATFVTIADETARAPYSVRHLNVTEGEKHTPKQHELGGDRHLQTQPLVLTQDVTMQGNLTVQGEQVIVNVSTVEAEDNTILLNRNETGAGVSAGFAGIEVERGSLVNVQILWDETLGKFILRDSSGSKKELELANITMSETKKWGSIVTYVVWKEGTMYYAKDGATGAISYSGDDATTVIQGAINSLSSGGVIALKNGIYTLSSSLSINADNITLRGETKGGAVLNGVSLGDYALKIGDGITRRYYLVLGDLTLKGGLKVNFVNGLLIQNCYFEQSGTSRWLVEVLTSWNTGEIADCSFRLGDNGGLKIGGQSNNIQIRNNLFESNKAYGIQLYGDGSSRPSDIVIESNYFESTSGWAAVLIYVHNSRYVWIEKNTIGITYDSSYDAIYVTGGDTSPYFSWGIIITRNRIEEGDNSHLRHAIYLHRSRYGIVQGNWISPPVGNYSVYMDSNSDNHLVTGNLLDRPIYDIGSSNTIKYNTRYVTEKSGTSTGTGAQETIPHGLSAIPNRVYLTANDAGITQLNEDAAADATNIYPICTSGKKYTWRAEKV